MKQERQTKDLIFQQKKKSAALKNNINPRTKRATQRSRDTGTQPSSRIRQTGEGGKTTHHEPTGPDCCEQSGEWRTKKSNLSFTNKELLVFSCFLFLFVALHQTKFPLLQCRCVIHF